MALSDLNLELDQLQDFLFGSRQVKAGEKGSLASEMAKDRHQFTLEFTEVVKQLKEHKEENRPADVPKRRHSMAEVRTLGLKQSASEKRKNEGPITKEYRAWKKTYTPTYTTPLEEFEPTIKLFVTELIEAYRNKVASYPDAFLTKKQPSNGIRFKVTSSAGGKSAYDILQDWKKELGNEVIDKGLAGDKEIFKNLFRPLAKGFGQNIHVGHDVALAEERALVGTQQIQQMSARLVAAGFNSDVTGLVKTLKETTKLTLDLEHARQINLQAGTLSDTRDVITNAETEWLNQLKSSIGLEGEVSETKIGQAVKKMIKEFREQLKGFYDPKLTANKKSSATIMEAAQAMILYGALDLSSKKNRKVKTKLKKPKSIAPRRPKQKTKTFDIKTKQTTKTSAIAGVKEPKAVRPQPKRGTTESGTSLAPLVALLNQKLPQTVAKNMGPPGLENQTGRFASSVQVTDVSRTAQGFPSVGYDYRRNPYQVFEMGSGQPPWATPDRDPRKVIDASIREIATQLAIGRFYTRRI